MNAIVELPTDHRRHAKHLYWQGYRVCEIAELISEKEKTLHSWVDMEIISDNFAIYMFEV